MALVGILQPLLEEAFSQDLGRVSLDNKRCQFEQENVILCVARIQVKNTSHVKIS